MPKNQKDINPFSMFSDPVTLPKKPEPATPDAEGGDGADAEDVQRFVFFLVTVFKSVYLFLIYIVIAFIHLTYTIY